MSDSPGWRSSRRTSKSGRKARRAAVSRPASSPQPPQKAPREKTPRTRGGARSTVSVIAVIVVVLAAVYLIAIGINAAARWWALREVQERSAPSALAEQAQENLLIIGVDEAGSAEFLAVRLDKENEQILGIGVPSAAFMEVPGQGYERVGQSMTGGPGVAMAAISNYLTVQFAHYVVVDVSVHRDAMANGSLRDVIAGVQETDLTTEAITATAEFIASVPGERTALVPLPVEPINLGGETYYEPQRDQIAALILQWWGVSMAAEDAAVRVIIYNGAGTPGLAGKAAQQLIEAGVRVVDTRNADHFGYEETLVVVQDGDLTQGQVVASALGVGKLLDQREDQDIADVIVIIGGDYVPPVEEGQETNS